MNDKVIGSKSFEIDKSNWRVISLSELAKEISARVDDHSGQSNNTFVGLQHFVTGELKIKSYGTSDNLTSSTKAFSAGDILFARRNAYLCRASLVDFDGVCSGDAFVFRENHNKLTPGFLAFIVNSKQLWRFANANAAGTMSKRVKWRDLAKHELLLPDMEEQSRISKLLWSLNKSIDLEESVLSKSLTVLDSYTNEFTSNIIDEYGTINLEDLIQESRPITYGILKPGKGIEGGIPVIKVRDYPDGEIVQEKLLLTTPEIEEPYKRSRLQKDDLLISIRGTVGRLAEVPESLDGANITQDTARIALADGINHIYIRAVLESSYFQRQVAKRTTGLAVQGINLGELRKLKVPFPPKCMQDEVATKIKNIKSAIECSRHSISSKKQLRSSIIEQVF
jgi:type I restriction enzyme S subunit